MSIDRRKFIKNTGLIAGGVLVFPTIIKASAFGANDKINLAMIGTGSHGIGWNLAAYLKLDNCKVVAVCDVDVQHALKAKNIIDTQYSNTDCKIYNDFREVLQRKDIDAVQISTPDHWHVPMSVLAIQAGKDVCCEKPTQTIEQGRILCNVVAKHDRIYQTSLEDRSLSQYLRMAELVRNGRIGKLEKVVCGLLSGTVRSKPGDLVFQPAPEGFDYNMWLGPAPEAPYFPGRCHGKFRFNFDYSGGTFTDWGAHMLDTAQRANGTEKSGPISVEGKGVFPTEKFYNTAETYNLTYLYKNGVVLDVHSDSREIICYGTGGWLKISGWAGVLEASSPEILNSVIAPSDIHLVTGASEHANFLECIKTRKETFHPVEDLQRVSTMTHIGNISMLLGRKLNWDLEKEEFVNDAEANAMRSREERDPWKLKDLVI